MCVSDPCLLSGSLSFVLHCKLPSGCLFSLICCSLLCGDTAVVDVGEYGGGCLFGLVIKGVTGQLIVSRKEAALM